MYAGPEVNAVPDVRMIWPVLTALGMILWHTIELMLGVVTPEEVGWLPVTLKSNLGRIFQWFSKPKVVSPMTSKNPNITTLSVDVDKPTYDAIGILIDVTQKLLSGEKPQIVAQEELGTAMALFGEIAQVAGDAALDRTTVEAAFALQTVKLIDTIMAARFAKVAGLPK